MTLEYYGYAGRILRVDLTKGKVWSEPLDPAMIRDFIGGRGFASKILYDEVDLNADPLAPQNPLIFATGPLTDLAPCSGRMTIAARSPATRIHGDSNVGGGFGIELKRAGFDVVVVKGRAEKPVYLWICDGKAEIRDASHLWGMRVRETTRTLLKEIGDLDAHVACIGPAGENLVYSAAVIVDYNRAAAKTGMGAVMGSKKLKALVARGTLGTKIYNPEKFREAFEDAIRAFADDPGSMLGRTIGSNFLHKVHNKKGALILKNGRLGYLEDIEWVSGETLNKYNLKPTSGCGLCYIACERNLLIKSEKYGDIFYSLEYYSLAAQSYRLGIYNLEDSIYNAKLAEDLGLDHTSPAHLIALAMELYERGIITKDDLDGLDLTWGNVEAVRTILEKMAYREGVGKLFADGYYGLIKRFPEAAKYALHVKGMDNIPQDARAARTYNMRYAISTRGADHMRSSGLSKLAGAIAVDDMAVSEAMKSFLLVENFTTMVNLLEVCTWAWSAYTTSFEYYKRKEEALINLYNAATGRNITIDDMKAACQRTILVERAENARYGLRRKDDRLPERFLKEPLPIMEGKYHPPITDFEERLTWYYRYRGIDEETGIPKKETLVKYGLGYVAEDLEKRGILR